jgi:hypothetical protein
MQYVCNGHLTAKCFSGTKTLVRLNGNEQARGESNIYPLIQDVTERQILDVPQNSGLNFLKLLA